MDGHVRVALAYRDFEADLLERDHALLILCQHLERAFEIRVTLLARILFLIDLEVDWLV